MEKIFAFVEITDILLLQYIDKEMFHFSIL